jgi:DNA-binding MarR family transcriptional regulator
MDFEQQGRAPSIGYLVSRLAVRWRRELDRALAPHGLTGASYAVLASLHALSARGAQPSQRELADFTGFEPMYVSKLARTLAGAGLLERADDPSDTRALRLRITDRGVAAVRAGRAVVLALEEQRLAPLGGRLSEAGLALHDTLLDLLRRAEAAASAPQPPPEPGPARARVRGKEPR